MVVDAVWHFSDISASIADPSTHHIKPLIPLLKVMAAFAIAGNLDLAFVVGGWSCVNYPQFSSAETASQSNHKLLQLEIIPLQCSFALLRDS